MNSENEHKLFQEFPDLFKKDLLSRGFECQDGWFALLYELAGQLENYLAGNKGCEKPQILMVRQQMGELRIDVFGGDQVIRRMIRQTQDKARAVCELDGEPAIGLFVCAPYWYRCLCRKCAELHDCMDIEDLRHEDSTVAIINELHLKEINLSEELFL